MELLCVAGALVVVLIVYGGRPRVAHWRGPQNGSMKGVQEEHLWLFHSPSDQGEEESP